MKKKIIAVMLCMVLCLFTLSPAFAEAPFTAKQILINKLKNTDLYAYNSEQYKTSRGKLTLQIETLNGSLISYDDMLPKLKNSSLALDYKLNTPEKKIAADYKAKFDNKDYKGSCYLDDKTFIISAAAPIIEELILKEAVDKKISYIYGSEPELEELWKQLAKQTNNQNAAKQLNQLLQFLLEAVPDKYIGLSLSAQKIVLDIDSNGFYQLVFSISEKIKNERERFAGIISETAVAVDPSADAGMIKKDIIDGIENSIARGEYPNSPEYIKQQLDGFKLDTLHCEFPLLSDGTGKIFTVFNIEEKSGVNGKITLDINFSGSKNNLAGNYAASFVMQNKSDNTDINVQITGQFKNNPNNADSTARFIVKVKNEYDTFIDLALKITSQAQADPAVQINIPQLTPSNSVNLNTYKESGSTL